MVTLVSGSIICTMHSSEYRSLTIRAMCPVCYESSQVYTSVIYYYLNKATPKVNMLTKSALYSIQTDCNNILESDAAKIGGVLSWSEVGLGYFISNITLLICYPSLISYLSIINICALPYTLWSVWYQYKIAKQWCVLCLLVQLLLWVLFTINISTGIIQQPDFLISHLFAVCSRLMHALRY